MKIIPLTQNQVTFVDDDTFDLLNQHAWYYKDGYAARNSEGDFRTTIRMHQHIIPLQEGFQIDHIDRNGLNNQRNNLRLVTNSFNGQNVIRKDNKSGYKGVTWFPNTRKWRAAITFNKKTITIGYSISIYHAAKMYDEKALELQGPDALTNHKLGLI